MSTDDEAISLKSAPKDFSLRMTVSNLVSIVCFILIALGIFFRFSSVDESVFWHDEASTLHHVSGYTLKESKEILGNRVFTFGDVNKTFQTPSSGRGAAGVVEVMKLEQPNHSPLYYVLCYFWSRYIDSEPESVRLVSVIISLFQIPAIFWLAFEVFGSRRIAAFAAAFMALSPFQMFFAQEARDYPLIVVMFCLCCASLLCALRKQKPRYWLIYAFCVSASLYCSVLSVLVLAGQFLYVLNTCKINITEERFEIPRKLFLYISATLAGVALTLPLLIAQMVHLEAGRAVVEWLSIPVSKEKLFWAWSQAPIETMLFGVDPKQWQFYLLLSMAYVILITSFILLLRTNKSQTSKFLLFVVLVPIVALWVPDLVLGGQRSLYTKYNMMLPIVVTVVIAYGTGYLLRGEKLIARLGAVVLALGCIICQTVSCQALSYNAERSLTGGVHLLWVFRSIILRSEVPFIVSSDTIEHNNFLQLMALSHMLSADSKLLLLSDADAGHIPSEEEHFFLFNVEPGVEKDLKKRGFSVEAIDDMPFLQEVKKAH